MRTFFVLAALLGAALSGYASQKAETGLPEQAAQALSRATDYFRKNVGVHGSYLWQVSEDLKTRRGEEVATETQGWVQPPGTPVVGGSFLRAWEATGERTYLDAARETARALAATQLASGGWDYRLEFDPEQRKQWFYRTDVEKGETDPGRRRNVSTYDDNNSQNALRFLMRVDTALEGKDAEIRRAVEYGLKKLLEAQYPNGAWPQRWNGQPHDAARYPVVKAHYPESWSRNWPGAKYQEYYTFNDNAIRDVILTMLEAHRTYKKPEYLEAARRGGEFILLAQMPEPQPAWAQQYNLNMEPAWARKFEPPSVVSSESGGVIRTLIDLTLYTGDEKFLKPIAPAVAWLKKVQLPGGQWARFYELKTDRPLYFTMKYELVYTDDDLPTHYAFKTQGGVPSALKEYEQLTRDGREKMRAARERKQTPEQLRRAAQEMEPRVRAAIAALDPQGRWLQGGTLRSATFNQNVGLLAEYLGAVRGREIANTE